MDRDRELCTKAVCRHHTCLISPFVRALISAFKARRELALDNVALRQQLAVLCRPVKRRGSRRSTAGGVTVKPRGPWPSR